MRLTSKNGSHASSVGPGTHESPKSVGTATGWCATGENGVVGIIGAGLMVGEAVGVSEGIAEGDSVGASQHSPMV